MDLMAEARARKWYHTIELAPGVVTDGWYDLRPYVHRYRLPERLDGKRALDVGTFDGFWAFELERRGAEVVAIDVHDESQQDWPPRRRPQTFDAPPRDLGFKVAKEALGSRVERVELNIYDLAPERVGTFDFVFCGSLIMHLRDQLLAMERIAGVCTGTFVSAEAYDVLCGFVPFPVSRYLADRDRSITFWLPSARTWRRMLWSAGFESVEEQGRFRLHTPGKETYVRHVVHHARK